MPADQAKYSNEIGFALNNFDKANDNILRVRAMIGSRMTELESLDSVNQDLDLQYQQTLSNLQDLDYAKAISDMTRKQTDLEAAQKSFMTDVAAFAVQLPLMMPSCQHRLFATALIASLLSACSSSPPADGTSTPTPFTSSGVTKTLVDAVMYPLDKTVYWGAWVAVAYLVTDPWAPNWEIQEARFPENHVHFLDEHETLLRWRGR